MQIRRLILALAWLVAGMTTTAGAAPIVYRGNLEFGQTVTSTNTQAPFLLDEPIGADYWRLFVPTAGQFVFVDGHRLAGHYDMAVWVLSGVYADTNQLGPFLDTFAPGFVALYDDEAPASVPGPFGDPRGSFVAPIAGFYTFIVTNGLSSASAPNPYTLRVPEPASLVLLGAGLAAGLARSLRRARVNARA